MADEGIRTYSMADLREMRNRGETLTDPDAPEYELDEAFWDNAKVVWPDGSESVRIAPELVAWFRRQDENYESQINAALRAWVEAHDQQRA